VASVDLGKFGGRATIGTKGDVKIAGDGVLPRHAEVWAASDGSVWLRSAGGEVWIERRGLRELVARPRRLGDGDVIVIGEHRLSYGNLAARRQPVRAGRASWMR
jgi:hypothetical protein